jgi:hypothetical protein
MAGDPEDVEDDEEREDMPLSDEDVENFVEDGDMDGDEAPLDPKERAARSLEIRRAIEARAEARRMRRELDYLDDE